MAEEIIHAVMLPWSAFGHLMPFFKLSIALAKTGVHVSYISTPKNIQRLPKLPSNLSHLIDLVEIPLPSLNKNLLPKGAEATMDIPFDKIQYLEEAYDQLQHPVRKLVSNWLPDWIICDYNPHWIVEIAQEFHVKLIYYSVVSAATLVFLGPPSNTMKSRFSPESLTSSPKWVTFPSSVAYKRNEAIAFFNSVHQETGSEVNRKACQGLLPVETAQREILYESRSGTGSESAIFEWLDKQATKSVVFVGFGSECKLSKEQVLEIAYGLEMSKLPFLWGLRKPDWACNDQDFVPIGFSERTYERGLVCMGWIPQQEILARSSTGGSLFLLDGVQQLKHCNMETTLLCYHSLLISLLMQGFWWIKVWLLKLKEMKMEHSLDMKLLDHLDMQWCWRKERSLELKTREAAVIVGNLKLHQDHYIAEFVQFLKDGINRYEV